MFGGGRLEPEGIRHHLVLPQRPRARPRLCTDYPLDLDTAVSSDLSSGRKEETDEGPDPSP